MNELCPKCLPLGYCEFESCANILAQDLKLNHSTDPKILLSQAVTIHTKISKFRIEARKNACPNINNIDPEYPGKNLL